MEVAKESGPYCLKFEAYFLKNTVTWLEWAEIGAIIDVISESVRTIVIF